MPLRKVEHVIEQGLFMSRWLMVPIYVGLASCLLALVYTFGLELFHTFTNLNTLSQHDVILTMLSLIDISLAGNLLLIVIYSGYENFVSKIEAGDKDDWPDWKGSVDFAKLKLKLIASIVAISGIHLLKVFMDVDKIPESQVVLMIAIHLTFVVSGVLMAWMDSISGGSKKKDK